MSHGIMSWKQHLDDLRLWDKVRSTSGDLMKVSNRIIYVKLLSKESLWLVYRYPARFVSDFYLQKYNVIINQ